MFRQLGLLVWLMTLTTQARSRYLPIFMMHGINDNHHEFDKIQGWLKEIDSQVAMHSLRIAEDSASYRNLWAQGDEVMDAIRKTVAQDPDTYKHGYTLLCHSQGALTCRTVVQRMDDHKVHTLIAMAGPQAGQYGIPGVWQKLVPWGRKYAFEFFFNFVFEHSFQKNLSIANFWNDPRRDCDPLMHPYKDYCKGNTFLPVLNSNPCRYTQGPHTKKKSHSEAARYKKNLLRLKKMVLSAGKKDDTIIPYKSGIFEFFKDDQKHKHLDQTVPLQETDLYKDDWIGLRALDESHRLVRIVSPDARHTDWTQDHHTFTTYIVDQLPTFSKDLLV